MSQGDDSGAPFDGQIVLGPADERARRVVAEAERRAVEWRWTDWGVDLGLIPLQHERFPGTPRAISWYERPPQNVPSALHVGFDGEGRVAVIHRHGVGEQPTRIAWEHRGELIDIVGIDNDLVCSVGRARFCDGRIVAYQSIAPDMCFGETYRYDDGRLVQIVMEDADPAASFSMVYDVRYDAFGEVSEVIQTHGDRPPKAVFRARRRSARALRQALAELVRARMLETLAHVREPESVRAICLEYESSAPPLPPALVVGRDARTRAPDATLDDFSAPEWYVPDADVLRLGDDGDWSALAELPDDADKARKLSVDALREVIKGTEPADLARALGREHDPPLLFAMDLERVDATTNLADALGRARAREVLRRSPGF